MPSGSPSSSAINGIVAVEILWKPLKTFVGDRRSSSLDHIRG